MHPIKDEHISKNTSYVYLEENMYLIKKKLAHYQWYLAHVKNETFTISSSRLIGNNGGNWSSVMVGGLTFTNQTPYLVFGVDY